jgi:hypothetical protein
VKEGSGRCHWFFVSEGAEVSDVCFVADGGEIGVGVYVCGSRLI